MKEQTNESKEVPKGGCLWDCVSGVKNIRWNQVGWWKTISEADQATVLIVVLGIVRGTQGTYSRQVDEEASKLKNCSFEGFLAGSFGAVNKDVFTKRS